MSSLDIVVRTCTRDNPLGPQTRYIPEPKSAITLVCLKSLIASINQWVFQNNSKTCDITLHVLDDQSCIEDKQKLKNALTDCLSSTVWQDIVAGSQPASMAYGNEYVAQQSGDLFYMLDDDYLHKPNAITELILSYYKISNFLQHDCVLSSCDHHCYYKPSDIVPGIVLLGESIHWKQTNATTASVFISSNAYRQFKYLWDNLALYDGGYNGISEITTINRAYSQIPAFHPLPSLSAHISYPDSAIPFFDHMALWNQYQ